MIPTKAAPRRARSRRGEGDRLRDEILAAAERLLIETGDEESVSIRALADAVGVTSPSIYLHFEDKTDLLFAVCEKHFQQLDRVTQDAAARSQDPLESLHLRGRAYVQFGLDHPEPYRILFMRKPATTPGTWDEERLRRSAAFGHLVDAVYECMAAGAIAKDDPFLVGMTLWAAVHGVTALLISNPHFPGQEQLIENVLTVQIGGLRNP